VAVYVSVASLWFVYVVVRGTDNSLYFNVYSPTLAEPWGSWVPLGGATNSPPTLIYDDYSNNLRLDLFVRGTDNGIWHKAGTINGGGGVSWASSWDSAGGATPSAVTAIWGTSGVVAVFVRGTDNGVYYNNMYLPSIGTSDTFTGWGAIGGATSMTMGADGYDSGYAPLILVGTDSALYGTDVDYTGWYTSPPFTSIYASAGGTVTAPPAVSYGYPCYAYDMDVLVAGSGGGIYINLFNPTATPSTAWSGYAGLGGSTPSTPAITNLTTVCG
jgi:hypothetical protein